jgi:kanamycin kinase
MTKHGSGRPTDEILEPMPLRPLLAFGPLTAVWQNEAGGLTFEGTRGDDHVFAKWAPAGSGLDLAVERAKLEWAGDYSPVPEVLDYAAFGTGDYLITRALPGDSAVSDRWLDDPETAVRAAGVGLRALHDRLPLESCPFTWSVEDRLAGAPPFAETPPLDQLVVCHGDPCVPNTIIGDDGQWVAHVDFGSLGVADRWADIAVGAWSTEWNYGPGWQSLYLAAYGIEADERRLQFYRDLWDRT